jgi:hypothetical protein
MSNHRLAVLAFASACASSSRAPAPDASTVPRTATGTFAVTSQLDLVTIPPPAADLLAALSSMLDAPDDPSRYVIDRLIDALPGGGVQNAARTLAPVIAAYVQAHLEEIAPRLVPGLHALSDGLARIGRRFGTIETLRIAADHRATRAVTAFAVAPAGVTVPLVLADYGLPDVLAQTEVGLDAAGELAVARHQLALPYGALLRLGLDHAVIATVDPHATDLATALRDLVDCARVGQLVADELIGSPDLYEGACEVGLTAGAAALYDRLAAADATLALDVAGTARGLDRDADHAMDAIDGGEWIGAAGNGELGVATFWGTRQ